LHRSGRAATIIPVNNITHRNIIMKTRKKSTKLDIIKRVVEEKQYTKIKMFVGTKSKTVILDFTTANQLLRLFTNAPQENIDKINQLPWDRLCSMAWSPLNRTAV